MTQLRISIAAFILLISSLSTLQAQVTNLSTDLTTQNVAVVKFIDTTTAHGPYAEGIQYIYIEYWNDSSEAHFHTAIVGSGVAFYPTWSWGWEEVDDSLTPNSFRVSITPGSKYTNYSRFDTVTITITHLSTTMYDTIMIWVDGSNNSIGRHLFFNPNTSYWSGVAIARSDVKINTKTNSDISFYPNPVIDKIHLINKQKFEIYSMLGQKLIEGNNDEINVKQFKTGNYILILNNKVQRFSVLK